MNIKTKIVTALTLAVFVVPGISLAQTMSVAQLQAEIQSLTTQLQSLEAQLAAASGSTIAWCYTFNTNLRIGMSGQEVTELQTALQKDGETVTVNGSFDDQTASAITAFQEKYASAILAPYGLSNGTGYAGKATRAELNSLFGCGTTNPTPTPTPTPISANNASVSLTVNGLRGNVSATSGSQITLAWTSSGVTNCIANSNGSWTGSVNTSGTSLATLPSVVSETGVQYSLTCTTPSGGSAQSSVQVNVQPSGTTASSNGFTISPSATTGFTQGGNNTISWNGGACPAGMPNSCVSLILENAQGSCNSPSVGTPCNVGYVPAPVNSPASGSFNWNAQTVCASTASYSSTWANCTAVSPGLYRIFAQDYNGNLVSTGDIWINAATTTTIPNAPSITITSPTAGQTWAAGTTQQITWTEQNVNTGEYQIYLKDLSADGDSALTELAPSIPNGTNYFNWAIPSNFSAGHYEMEVTSPETSVNAVSQPFSIIIILPPMDVPIPKTI